MDSKNEQVEHHIEPVKGAATFKYDNATVQKAQDIYSHGQEAQIPVEDEPWREFLWKRRKLLLRISIIYLAVLNVGFDYSVTNTSLGMPSFRKYFGHPNPEKEGDYIIPATYQSGWNGGTFAGQIATDLIAGWLADKIGRKWTLFLSVSVIIAATTIQATAHNIAQIIAGKTVFGVGIGLYIAYITSYTAELAPSRLRGIVCMSVNFCIQVGQWIGSGAALGLVKKYPDISDSRSWRIIFCLQYIFAGLFMVFFYWLPESPIYHIHHEQYEKAEEVIKTLYGEDYDYKSHVAFLTNEAIAEQKMRNVGKSISYFELFKGRNLIRLFISACIIWPILMGTGFWPGYQTYYFELAGAKDPQAMNYGCTTVAIGTSILAYMLIENVGRRKLWLIGAAGMTASNLIGGFMSIPYSNGHKTEASAVATAMVFLWNGFYDIGPANMGYAISPEVASSRMRVRNNALVHVFSHATGFAFSWAVPYMYNPDQGNLGLKIGYVWGGFGVIFVIWGYFFIPDLKGRNFYEIDQLFENRVPINKFHKALFDENDALILDSVFKNAPLRQAETMNIEKTLA